MIKYNIEQSELSFDIVPMIKGIFGLFSRKKEKEKTVFVSVPTSRFFSKTVLATIPTIVNSKKSK